MTGAQQTLGKENLNHVFCAGSATPLCRLPSFKICKKDLQKEKEMCPWERCVNTSRTGYQSLSRCSVVGGAALFAFYGWPLCMALSSSTILGTNRGHQLPKRHSRGDSIMQYKGNSVLQIIELQACRCQEVPRILRFT
jgi:hypothetical protein